MYEEPLSGLYFATFKYNLMQWSISAPVPVSLLVKFSIQLAKSNTWLL